jgi:hypothetical protein
VVLSKENHTQLTEAATVDRKSGEAEGSAVRLSDLPNFPSKPQPQTEVSSRLSRPAVGPSEAKWRDLLFLDPNNQCRMGAPPYPLSSRPQWRDLQFRGPPVEMFPPQGLPEQKDPSPGQPLG